MKRHWLYLSLGLALMSAPAQAMETQLSAPRSNDEVKAAFLYNFAKFVTWPDTMRSQADAPFVLGIFGADPFAQVVNRMIQGEVIQGHPLTVKRVTGPHELEGCRMVFFGSDATEELGPILNSAGRLPILTVGDTRKFANLGGMIIFVETGSRLGFDINARAAELAGLKISSKLLKLAVVIPSG